MVSSNVRQITHNIKFVVALSSLKRDDELSQILLMLYQRTSYQTPLLARPKSDLTALGYQLGDRFP
ncbi:hypothetical protein [Allocoleopsis sp.]|uniref:hypothetical protein n=1 Tax=Allocoleopsis sp. TaxID=3088169 RepID=UPI002FCF3D90